MTRVLAMCNVFAVIFITVFGGQSSALKLTESQDISSFEADSREAKHFLRSKRANQFMEERVKKSSLERECIEEICSGEEYLEFAENQTAGIRPEINLQIFEVYYKECMTVVSVNDLDDPKKLDMRGACLRTFQVKSGLDDELLFNWPENISKNL